MYMCATLIENKLSEIIHMSNPSDEGSDDGLRAMEPKRIEDMTAHLRLRDKLGFEKSAC